MRRVTVAVTGPAAPAGQDLRRWPGPGRRWTTVRSWRPGCRLLARPRKRHTQARAIVRDLGTDPEEARVLQGLGQCHLQHGDPGQGAAHPRRALAIYQRIGAPVCGASRQPPITTGWQPPPRSPSQRIPTVKAISRARPPDPGGRRTSACLATRARRGRDRIASSA